MRSDEDIRVALAARIATLEPEPPEPFTGRGIVISAGGAQVFTNAYVLVFVLRRTLKSTLPIEVWHLGEAEMTPAMRELLEALDVSVVDAHRVLAEHPARIADGWQLKPYALMRSRFAEVLLLDSDQVPLTDPAALFDWPEYASTGAVFWPDIMDLRAENPVWALFGMPPERTRSFESGQALVDKRRHWRAMQITLYLNEEADTFYNLVYGDKDTFLLGWRLAGAPFHLMSHMPLRTEFGMVQRDRDGAPLFQHRTSRKWRYGVENPPMPSFQLQAECEAALADLEARWAGRLFRRPARSAAARALEAELADALLRIAMADGKEDRVLLNANGDIGGARTHDRQHWYVVDRAEDGLALVFSNGERETAWLKQEVSGDWRGRRLAPPAGELFASIGAIAETLDGDRRTLVDDLLEAAGFPDAEDDALRVALSLIQRSDDRVPDRLRAIASGTRFPPAARRRLETLAAELEETAPPARSGGRPIVPDTSILRALYIDNLKLKP